MNNFHFRTLLCAFFLMLTSVGMQAQSSKMTWAIGFHGLIQEPNTGLGNHFFELKADDHTFGLGLSLNRYINRNFDLGLFVSEGKLVDSYQSYFFENYSFTADVRARYKFYNGYLLKEDARFGPYATAGLGIAHYGIEANGYQNQLIEGGNTGLEYYGGIGVHVKLNEQLSLTWETGIHFPTYGEMDADKNNDISKDNNNRSGLFAGNKDKVMEHSLGLIIGLGKTADSDRDGVSDKNDECPGTPVGIKVDAKGCPVDSDKDGIPDHLDDCPEIPGLAALKGCPDKDGDNIADKDDKCPDVKGLASFKGCPDADGDGVTDGSDKCPGTKVGYKVDANGCPKDDDKDNVVNEEDACPTVAGLVELKGCPDGDGDGIADKDDVCPTVKGIVANKGCPEVPKEVVSKLNKIAENIFFETGSDKLKDASKARLDDVAAILNQYKESKLTIDGHTDNVGDPAMNLTLSQKRCDSVKSYLASKGISANRLVATGYGDTKPVADNKTSDGRAKNRRVELKMEY